MSETKIVLSDKELDMVNDRQWILTKQGIIEKVFHLFESVIPDIDSMVLPKWNALTKQPSTPPRIFKGENYLGLPYVTLDYPKRFDTEKTLTLRTMFWWGNFMSITLHAGSLYHEHLMEKLQKNSYGDIYVCVHENQWHHHFEPGNYVLLNELSHQNFEAIKERDFIKVAYKINLDSFNELPGILTQHYRKIADIISFQDGGKAL